MKSRKLIKSMCITAIALLTVGLISSCDGDSESMQPLYTLSSDTTEATVEFASQDADEQAQPGSLTVRFPSRTVGSLPSQPVKSGKVFACWTTEPDGNGVQFTEDTRVTGAMTVYASWATPGLEFTLINNGNEYSVRKGSAITNGDVVIPGYWNGKKVTAIEPYAFMNCTNMTSVTIPDHVTSIGKYAFYVCSGLTSISLPENLVHIGDGAFYNCMGLTSVMIPGNVTEIGVCAFSYCSNLTELAFTNHGSLATIKDSAFAFCSGLAQVTIPASVTNIGHRLFNGCSSLATISLDSNEPPAICISIFNGCSMLAAIKVPPASLESYKIAEGWINYSDIIVSQ